MMEDSTHSSAFAAKPVKNRRVYSRAQYSE